MREIVMDTETTGLDPADGHRIVEIGAVELVNLLPTGRIYHQYINPERNMPKEAEQVHGLSGDFLSDKPVFARIAPAFLEFIGDARLVIHNAAFDLRMLNAEFERLGQPRLPMSRAIDTLEIARSRFPGAQASLDALCRRFDIDNSGREKHGALLDSELLAEVYLELMGGRQQGLGLDPGIVRERRGSSEPARGPGAGYTPPPRPRELPPRITEAERSAHDAFVEELGDGALWASFARSGAGK
ncbi:MAG TPA: DNA polymerase III subunit epsilon [Thermohalobaculum sp.]|nr:DNA polymerase III subunit epsilon [Thermohalobaculum sp.]